MESWNGIGMMEFWKDGMLGLIKPIVIVLENE